MGGGFFQKARIYIAPASVPEIIKAVTDEKLMNKPGKLEITVKNQWDNIEFIVEEANGNVLLSLAGDHILENGKKDQYGILDIPLAIEGKYVGGYVNKLAEDLREYC